MQQGLFRHTGTPTFLCAICHDVMLNLSHPSAQERRNLQRAGKIVHCRHTAQMFVSTANAMQIILDLEITHAYFLTYLLLMGDNGIFELLVEILIGGIPLPFKMESTTGSGCTTTGSSEGKGQPGQEMHHGTAAEKNEKGVWEREEERGGGLVIFF